MFAWLTLHLVTPSSTSICCAVAVNRFLVTKNSGAMVFVVLMDYKAFLFPFLFSISLIWKFAKILPQFSLVFPWDICSPLVVIGSIWGVDRCDGHKSRGRVEEMNHRLAWVRFDIAVPSWSCSCVERGWCVYFLCLVGVSGDDF